MYDLLKAALRQRPEYILVGEVRGEEALTLFQAMSTGHTTYSTMHAGDVQTVVNRLENNPMNVPHAMLQSLDIVCIQVQTYVGEVRVRRSNSIVEVTGLDTRTGNIRINEIYRWDPAANTFKQAGESYVLNSIMQSRGWGQDKLVSELGNRGKILEYMHGNGMRDYIHVSLVVQAYAVNPELVLEAIKSDTLQEMISQHL
jgi:flagellar protein FlaI